MKTIAIYARVSTNNQTLASQLDTLKDYCKLRGWHNVIEYLDEGISGVKTNRPALNQLMSDAQKKKFDTVLVFRFDRFARSTAHLSQALLQFQALGIDFISYSENIDTSTPMGQAMFTIISAINQLERDIINERVKAGISAAKRKGTTLGRPKKDLEQTVKRLKNQGKGIRAIQKELNVGSSLVYRCLKA